MSTVTGLRARWVLARENGRPTLLRDATVVVSGSRIDSLLGQGAGGAPDRTIDLGESLLMPGFINSHCHCVSGPLFRGLLEDHGHGEGTASVIDKVMLPLAELITELSDDDEIAAIAALGQLEALKAGSTTIVDMPRSGHDAFAVAARDIGLRAYIHPYLMSGPEAGWSWEDSAEDEADARRALEVFHRWHRAYDEGEDGRIRIGLGPHAPDTCAPALLRAVARVRDETGARVVTHLAQSPAEMLRIRERLGVSPVTYLDRVGLIAPGLIAAHGICAEAADLRLLAERGATIAHCPLSYARLGTMACRNRFTAAGIPTAVASDAHALDIVADLRLAAINSKIDAADSAAGTAWEMVEAATVVPAMALGRADLGRLEPGASADLIAIRLDRPHLQPVSDPIKNLVWNGSGRDVDFVMVTGEVLVQDGIYARRSEQSVVKAGAAALEHVWGVAEERGIIDRSRPASA